MSDSQWRRRPVDLFWKQGDTAPTIAVQLLDGSDVPVVLTGASVKFMMQAPGGPLKVNAAATIVNALNGTVSYTPSAADTDTVGDYIVEWQVTYGGGAVETFPNGAWQKVRVKDDVAA